MGLQTFNANDKAFVERLLTEEAEDRLDAQIDAKTRQAERGDNPPEIVLPGYDPAESMSWDYSSGNEEHRIAELRSMRQRGVPLRPECRIPHADGTLENVYAYEADLQCFAQGLACANCTNWVIEDAKQHREKLTRLIDLTGYAPPHGVPRHHLCGYCGNNIEKQKRESAA